MAWVFGINRPKYPCRRLAGQTIESIPTGFVSLLSPDTIHLDAPLWIYDLQGSEFLSFYFFPFVIGAFLEQRRFPRYQLATPLTGVVEQEGARYPGSVFNISVGGFYLHLSRLLPDSLKIHGVDDYGEILYAGRNAFGFGNLVRIEKFSNGVGIGFSWDRDGMDEGSSLLIGEVIKEQEIRRSLGSVTTKEDEVILGGFVSSALTNDIFPCLRSVGADKARLSLADCTSIDSSGIEMLMALRDRGVPIVNLSSEIESIVQRFQLTTPSPDKKSNDAG